MAVNKHTLNKLGLTLWMAASVVMPNVSSAAPGTLASVPLFTQANADPNIMFLLDTSYSMNSALGASTRLSVAKSALSTLVNNLNNVRAGYAIFDQDQGADLLVNIGDIASTRSTINSNITSTSADDFTPLGSALMDVGRYFANNASGNCGGGSGASTTLTLHPGQASETTDRCIDILGTRITTGGPITAAEHCASNFTILVTDGLARGDQNIGPSHPLYDYDGDCLATAQADGGYTCADPDPSGTRAASFSLQDHHDRKSTYTYDPADDRTSDHLDDVAQALFEMDLRPDVDDDDGNAVTNNMRTFVIGFADPSLATSDLLQDTADQGGGTFSYANDGTDLSAQLDAATSSILNLIGSAAAVTFNSATLGTDSSVYLALFNSSSWSGDLLSYDLNDTTGAIEGQQWSAATQLDALSNIAAVSGRTILTYRRTTEATPTKLGQGIPFRWPADHTAPTDSELNTHQINDLKTNAPSGQEQAFGQRVVSYLRGDTSLEGSTFRNRTSRLGDIVHAGPIYVGPPELNWPDGNGSNGFPETTEAYSQFKLNDSTDTIPGQADRPGVVYIGSNDGFLHGFATDDVSGLWSAGEEILAYAPNALFSTEPNRGYHYLTEPGYNHQYYVDALPAVSDYYDGADWKTILVGGLRGGGRAMYALDITNPRNFSEANAGNIVKWEFTNSDDADLGYTFGTPTIALMNNNRWAVIMGNGYNPDTSGGATGEASLFIIFLDANLSDGSWDINDDYIKISTGVGTAANLNGLSTPSAVDLDGDDRIDRIYAGDLHGNMWAFNVEHATNPGNWVSAYRQGSTPKPLFIAGSSQPITVQPEVVRNPNIDSGSAPNTLVLFGTGQYLASGDNANLGNQAFYGIWDHGTRELNTGNLVEQQIGLNADGDRIITNNDTVDYAGGVDGWYINFDMNSDGERMVTNPVVRGDIVYFNTSIPSDVTCSYGGTGWQMSIDFAEGHNPDPAVVDTNGDGVVNTSDIPTAGGEFEQGLPAAPSFLSNRRYTPGTRTQTGGQVVQDAVENLGSNNTGRLSWEELTQ